MVPILSEDSDRRSSSVCKLLWEVVILLALLYRYLTRPLFTLIGWCEWKCRVSVVVCGLLVHGDIQSIMLCTWVRQVFRKRGSCPS